MVNVFLNLTDFTLRFTKTFFERIDVTFFTPRLVFSVALSFWRTMEMGRFDQSLAKR